MAPTPLIRDMRDIREMEQIPLEQRFREKNVYELLVKGSGIDPDRTALSFLLSGDLYEHPVEASYRELIGRVRQTANFFHDLGVGPEDVVTYLLPNLIATHYVLWGAEIAGISNPINPLLEPATIRDICRAARTRVLVALGEVPGSNIWDKVEAIRKEIPTVKSVVRVMGPSDEQQGIYGFEEKIEAYPRDRLSFSREIGPDEISSLYHTGGTTGTPKLARRTHFNEVFMAWVISLMGGMNPEETLLCGLPLFHVNATTVTGLAPFSIGARVVLLSPMGYRDPTIMKNFYKIVEKYRAASFSCVPTVLSVLLDTPKGGADISSLRYAVCGAAPLSVELFRRFEAHSGMKVLEGYGLTEGTCASAINPKDGERKVGSIGLHMPYQQMKIVILDEAGNYERDAAPGEIGVVAIRGPNVFKGYVEEAHNRGLWIQGDWLHTGDLGRMDEDGYFWLTGRKKELIIRGGHNIDPAVIEEPLYKLPAVKLAAAVGKPDAHAGEVPVAYVELKEGAHASAAEILEHARGSIGERAAVPKEVYVLDQMPLTPIGKVFKPALRWDATRRTYAEELKALGELASSVEVEVREDKVHGTTVRVRVRPAAGVTQEAIRGRVSQLLARYTVHHELTIE
ncbi:MAG: acyl-CoA synthetase [bacterium]